MGCQKQNHHFPSEKKENNDNRQYKEGRHSAIRAAKKEKSQGQKEITEYQRKYPGAGGIGLKVVAGKHQTAYQKDNAGHYQNHNAAGSHAYPKNSRCYGGGHAN
jgi:hypothetical protein